MIDQLFTLIDQSREINQGPKYKSIKIVTWSIEALSSVFEISLCTRSRDPVYETTRTSTEIQKSNWSIHINDFIHKPSFCIVTDGKWWKKLDSTVNCSSHNYDWMQIQTKFFFIRNQYILRIMIECRFKPFFFYQKRNIYW